MSIFICRRLSQRLGTFEPISFHLTLYESWFASSNSQLQTGIKTTARSVNSDANVSPSLANKFWFTSSNSQLQTGIKTSPRNVDSDANGSPSLTNKFWFTSTNSQPTPGIKTSPRNVASTCFQIRNIIALFIVLSFISFLQKTCHNSLLLLSFRFSNLTLPSIFNKLKASVAIMHLLL